MASYDPAGNMTGDGTHTYQWDAEDRMVSVDSGSTATLKYNSLGQRVERFLPNGSWTFDYLFGLSDEELGLYSAGTTAWFDQNVPMGGRVLVMYGSPSRFLHANKLGTTTVTTDQTGAELQDELFYPWGQDWTRAGQPYVMHFAGMQGFENPGLVYPTDFRRYNPALGRWMTPDPMGGDATNPQSLNRYAYVLNNPVSNIDPTGLSCVHTDDGVTVDNLDGKGCSEMNNTPDQVDVSDKAPASLDTSSLTHLGSLSSIGDTSPGAGPGPGRVSIGPAPPSKPKLPADTRQSCGSVYLNALAESNTYDHAETTKQLAEAGAGAAAAESLKWQMERLLVVPFRSPYVRLFENASRVLAEASEVIPLALATYAFGRADFAVAKARINGTCRAGF